MDKRIAEHRGLSFFTPTRLLVLIVALGGLLRFYRFDALSLWLDEGFTVYFSRFPWHTVLGLDGTYDVHPPLYYALVKAVSLGVPEVVAGRLISVVAGTITIPVFYALAARLVSPWAGIISSLVLAISPLHIWYSQEARQYALVVLLVCTSYLALIAFSQSMHPGWALLYFTTLLLGLYIDYSAIYALLPQSVILAFIVRKQGRRAAPIAVAAAGAVVGFLPWLPQLLRVAGNVSNQDQFIVTPLRVGSSLLSIMGLAQPLQGQSEPGGVLATVTTQTPASILMYVILLLGAVPATIVGLAALTKVSRLAATMTVCLLAGTIATAVVLSLVYPGYVKRTVLSATLGWALLIGAAPFAERLAPPIRLLSRASVAFCLAVSLAVLFLVYTTADKQHWRDLAADTAAEATTGSGTGELLITYPTITDTLLDVYQPELLETLHIRVDDGGTIPLPVFSASPPHSVWLAYIQMQGVDTLENQLQAHGYSRIEHKSYPGTLYLDSYSLP